MRKINQQLSSKGFTLLEVIVATALMSMMLVGVSSLFMSAERGYEYSLQTYTLETNTSRAIARVSKLLKSAQILAAETHWQGGTFVAFQVPVDWDNDGDVIDDSNNVEWGVPFPNVTGLDVDKNNKGKVDWLGQVYLLRFMEAGGGNQYQEWNDSETSSSRTVDYNGDGDSGDSFPRGSLVLEVYENIDNICIVTDGNGDGLIDDKIAGDDVVVNPEIYNESRGEEPPISRQHKEVIADPIANVDWIDPTWEGPGTTIPSVYPEAGERYYDFTGPELIDGVVVQKGDAMFEFAITANKVKQIKFTVVAFVKDTYGQTSKQVRSAKIKMRNGSNQEVWLLKSGVWYND